MNDETTPCKDRLRGGSDPNKPSCTILAGLATVSKTERECARESAAYSKLGGLPEYADAKVDGLAVTTRYGARQSLNTEEDVLKVFDAIKKIHKKGVVHVPCLYVPDLKAEPTKPTKDVS